MVITIPPLFITAPRGNNNTPAFYNNASPFFIEPDETGSISPLLRGRESETGEANGSPTSSHPSSRAIERRSSRMDRAYEGAPRAGAEMGWVSPPSRWGREGWGERRKCSYIRLRGGGARRPHLGRVGPPYPWRLRSVVVAQSVSGQGSPKGHRRHSKATMGAREPCAAEL